MNVFSAKSYRKFLKSWLSSPAAGRSQADLARAARCSPSWLTRALSGDVNLTPDQAYAIAQGLQMAPDEADYFCLLVDWERAATPPLKKRLQQKLDALAEQNRGFQASIASDTRISDQECIRYYSSWIYASIHVASMIAPHSDADLAARFGVARATARAVLSDLQAMGLVAPQAGTWRATSKNIHLPANQLMAGIGHAIWRNKVVDHLQRSAGSGLHYSAVHCLSRADIAAVAETLKAAVRDAREIIDRSPSETLAVLCLDWYEHDR